MKGYTVFNVEQIDSLPHELTHDERVELTRAFVHAQFVAKGYVADIAWHAPEERSDDRNYHAHVLVTLRRALQDGFAKTKDRPAPGQHPAEHWKTELGALRVAWSEFGARALNAAGFALEAERFRDGHMTLEKQREAAIKRGDQDWADALDREPEPKQGPLATKIEKEGRESHAGNDRRDVKQRNAELAALKAEHAALTAAIIDLEIESLRRGRMDELSDDILKRQPERETELLEQAKQREAEFAELRRRKEEEAKEAIRQQEERKRAEMLRAKEGEISDPRARYAQALADNYNINDPYGSLARAAMAEYKEFAKRQDEYRKSEAAETDPEKRRIIQLSRQIEAHDYMAITSDRCAIIGGLLAGPDAEKRAERDGRTTDMTRDRKWAEAYREQAKELRQQRSELIGELAGREKESAQVRTQQPTKQSKDHGPSKNGPGGNRHENGKAPPAHCPQPGRSAETPSRQNGGDSRSGNGKSGHDYYAKKAREHDVGLEGKAAGPSKEMDERATARLSKFQNVGDLYAQHDAAKAMQPSQSRGRSR
jgi:hypothetical protein